MRCNRCRGLMVLDHFLDLKDGKGDMWLRVWRCVNCGDVVEPLIAHHRRWGRSKFLHLVDRWTAKRPPVPEVVRLSA